MQDLIWNMKICQLLQNFKYIIEINKFLYLLLRRIYVNILLVCF